jgi:hypothetical protein
VDEDDRSLAHPNFITAIACRWQGLFKWAKGKLFDEKHQEFHIHIQVEEYKGG